MQAQNIDLWKSRTDLAVELAENIAAKTGTVRDGRKAQGAEKLFRGEDIYGGETEVEDGIYMTINQMRRQKIKEVIIRITNEQGAKSLGKEKGTYVTIEGEDLSAPDDDYHKALSECLAKRLKEMLDPYEHILVVGLGNDQVTPDALGPFVVDNLYVTRHLKREGYLSQGKTVSAITPGVMGQTGMETVEILRGIAEQVKPGVILAVDALAARNGARLNRTIQICDTGIAPGSGVGNHRQELTKKTLGIPVIGLGVPTVISVPTLVNDALAKMTGEDDEIDFSRFVSPELTQMYVTPKNVDEAVKKISFTISEAINGIIDIS